MTEIWLSVREITRGAEIEPGVLDEVDGIHLDLCIDDPPWLVEDLANIVSARPESLEYDIHFIDGEVDGARILSAVEQVAGAARRVYHADPSAHARWGRVLTASDVASGRFDDQFRDEPWILMTAPPAHRSLAYRADAVQEAVRRIVSTTGGRCKISLDRDLDVRFATDHLRRWLTEVVIGKAILRAPNQAKSARKVRVEWT